MPSLITIWANPSMEKMQMAPWPAVTSTIRLTDPRKFDARWEPRCRTKPPLAMTTRTASSRLRSDQVTNNDNVLLSKVFYDLMGRTIESQKFEGGTNYLSVQTQYDSLGRPYKVSNPFRPQSEGVLWTTQEFDALGRVKSIKTPDNAVVNTSYSGNTVTVTDQTAKARKSVTDGLGRLITV